MFALCLQDLTSPVHLPEISVYLCAGVFGLYKLHCLVPGHTDACSTLFAEISWKKGKEFRLLASHFFSLKCIILLLPKKRCLLDVENSVLPGTSAAYRGYIFIQTNESIVIPRSQKAETSAGMMSRLPTEFSNVK